VLFGSAALTSGVLILAIASSAMFGSSTSAATLSDDLTQGCRFGSGLSVDGGVWVGPPQTGGAASEGQLPSYETFRSTLTAAVSPIGDAAPPVLSAFADNGRVWKGAVVFGKGGVQFVHRDGFLDHIEVLERSTGTAEAGVWLSDITAKEISVHAGDQVSSAPDGATDAVMLTVSGVYRDLALLKRGPFWCSLETTFVGRGAEAPSSVAFLEMPPLLSLAQIRPQPVARVSFESPPDPSGWTLRRARRAVAGWNGVKASVTNPADPLARTLGGARASVDRIESLRHAERSSAIADASAGPISLGIAALALMVLAVAARVWVDRKQQELTLLAVRGAGPGALTGKALLELGAPVILGGLAGFGASVGFIRVFGPSALIDRTDIGRAGLLSVAVLAVAFATVAIVIYPAVRRAGLVHLGSLRSMPTGAWEVVVLSFAAAAFYEMSTRGSPLAPTAGSTRVDALVLLFPLLAMLGSCGLCARVLMSRRVLAGRSSSRQPVALWLARRRLAARRSTAVTIVTGTAVAIGMIVFGGSLSRSLQATIDGKALLRPGAEQAFTLYDPGPLPPGLRGVGSMVKAAAEDTVQVRGKPPVDVLGVDPATFADAAFWRSDFAGPSLRQLLQDLGDGAVTPGSPVPVIAVGPDLPDEFLVKLTGANGPIEVPVRVAARAKAFPGLGRTSGRPLVVVNVQALDALEVKSDPELWLKRAELTTAKALRADGLLAIFTRTPGDRTGGALQPELWALRYLRQVGLLGTLVVVAGVGLYFGSASERRRLSSTLALRLGLSRVRLLAATGAETALMALAGLVLGTISAIVVTRLVFTHLDPLPGELPAAVLRFDWAVVGWASVGIVIVSVVAAAVVEHRSRGAALPEVLRRVG
jgi:putative ABC transport system permease protein